MHPILFRIGTYVVYSYTVALALGMAIGTWLAYRAARAWLADPVVLLDGAFWALSGGLIGARTGYVLANWAYFAAHLGETIDLRGGGLSWYGAWLGGAIAGVAWYALRGRFHPPLPDWRVLLDLAAPALALASAAGWLGCLLAGACYGAEAEGYGAPLRWITGYAADIYGVEQVRFLTQPLMIGWCLLLWGVLQLRSSALRRLPAGTIFALYLLLYALADGTAWFLRGDGTWRIYLWPAQWASILQICVALALIVHARAKRTERQPGMARSTAAG
jgi:phosphatidylglycerol:prolipoprotein diacylglycerol transferase